jgi:hypothetical protein
MLSVAFRRIKNREKDLQLLKKIGREQFPKFDELQRNANAKTIQNAWRNKHTSVFSRKSDHQLRRSTVRFSAPEQGQVGVACVTHGRD